MLDTPTSSYPSGSTTALRSALSFEFACNIAHARVLSRDQKKNEAQNKKWAQGPKNWPLPTQAAQEENHKKNPDDGVFKGLADSRVNRQMEIALFLAQN